MCKPVTGLPCMPARPSPSSRPSIKTTSGSATNHRTGWQLVFSSLPVWNLDGSSVSFQQTHVCLFLEVFFNVFFIFGLREAGLRCQFLTVFPSNFETWIDASCQRKDVSRYTRTPAPSLHLSLRRSTFSLRHLSDSSSARLFPACPCCHNRAEAQQSAEFFEGLSLPVYPLIFQ